MESIKYWPISERPREKLLTLGSEHLTDGELLAILLGTGNRGKSAMSLARELLQHFSGLRGLCEASCEEVCHILGMGKAKYVLLKASLELSKRYLGEGLKQQSLLSSVEDTKSYLKKQLRHQKREIFACLYLDNGLKMLHYEPLFYGSLHSTEVHLREVIVSCLKHNAAALIVAHNHPSGDVTPSDADKELTLKLQQALDLLEIRLVDHIIVGANDITSFAERGYL